MLRRAQGDLHQGQGQPQDRPQTHHQEMVLQPIGGVRPRMNTIQDLLAWIYFLRQKVVIYPVALMLLCTWSFKANPVVVFVNIHSDLKKL